MADVNWEKYHCDLCRTVSFIGAATASVLALYVLAKAGFPIWLLCILFLVLWGFLLTVVDRFCHQRSRVYAGAGHGVPDAQLKDQPGASAAPLDAASAANAVDGASRIQIDGAEPEDAGPLVTAEQAVTEVEGTAVAAQAKREAEEVEATEPVMREAEAKAAVEKAEQEAAAKANADKTAAEEVAHAEAVPQDAATQQAETILPETGLEGGGTRPDALEGPRDGQADDLKRIRGIGPKLEILCHDLGFYHFDQIAAWTSEEVAWVDANLQGFKGRVTRDAWVQQAGILASGADTEFSRRVDNGDVQSSR